MNRKILVGMVAIGLSLLVTVPFALAAQPSVTASGNGVPGKVLKVNGAGFVPGEVVELVLEMDGVPIIVGKKGVAIKADAAGKFEAQTNYPHKLVAVSGSWPLSATGDKGSTAVCQVAIQQP